MMTPELAGYLMRDPREWPRCLSDEELEEEWTRVQESATPQPISSRMLRAERERRKEQHGH